MKLHILSDLHLAVFGLDRPETDADVVILAGDIGRPDEAVAWARHFGKPVLYVPGNHEFYGGSIDGTAAELGRLSAGTCIRVLDNAEIVIGPIRFLGATLWTDFGLFGKGENKTAAMAEGQRLLRDFSRIRLAEAADASFSPGDSESSGAPSGSTPGSTLHTTDRRW
jgi:Calcineurin-like phosphoesterase superfamily domain